MTDRRNRVIMTIFGLLAFLGGGAALLYGAGVFGDHRAARPVIDGTVVHRWDEYGARSFAVIGAIGLVLFIVGLIFAGREWRRNDGRSRAGDITFPIKENERGQTTLSSPALSHALEADLKALPDVSGALVGLFGNAPHVELRSLLDVSDQVDLKDLPKQFDEAMDRFAQTVDFRPDPIQVTLRFRGRQRERRLQ